MVFCYRAYKDNIQPWRLVEDPTQVFKLTKAGLTHEQIDLLRNTRKWVAQKREPRDERGKLERLQSPDEAMLRTQSAEDPGDHYDFISQLYDEHWKP